MDLFDFKDGREGYYGEYGGTFLPEILHSTIEELKAEFRKAKDDPTFWQEFLQLMQSYSGRPTPVTHLSNLSKKLGGAQIYIKREDLNHTGSHKINNVMGQGLLVKRMGKTRVIAETGAGQHGYATATMAARFGFESKIYMGAIDVARQRPNVFWMENMGSEVVAVTDGQQTLKDAINECLRDWVTNFPEMVSWFQSIIGREAREQMLESAGKLPDRIFACVGGGSNAIGLFQGFMDDKDVQLVGCEAGGFGPGKGNHASRLAYKDASVGVAQGMKTYFLQNDDGNMLETHSVAAGLDYIGVNPILVDLWEKDRVRFEAVTDSQVTEALKMAMRTEGVIPALESSHGFAQAILEAETMSKDDVVLINMSGRGDKDIFTIADALGDEHWKKFIRQKSDEYTQQD